MVGIARRGGFHVFENIPEESVTMMERPGGFGSNYAASDVDADVPAPPPGFQRHLSRSEPRLNLPKFHIGQMAGDNEESALSRVMSGLFHADANYKSPIATPLDRSTNDLHQAGNEAPVASSSGLFGLTLGGQPLRKSVSAATYDDLDRAATERTTTAMVGGGQSELLRVPGTTVGGSSMQLQQQQPQQQHSLQQQTSLVEQASTLGAVGGVQRTASGFSFFNRGFFAKPVLSNQEDSYRYIMALDR